SLWSCVLQVYNTVPGRLPHMYIVLYLGVLVGFFHAAWACPCWVFPHWLDSVQHPIPQGDGAYKFDDNNNNNNNNNNNIQASTQVAIIRNSRHLGKGSSDYTYRHVFMCIDASTVSFSRQC